MTLERPGSLGQGRAWGGRLAQEAMQIEEGVAQKRKSRPEEEGRLAHPGRSESAVMCLLCEAACWLGERGMGKARKQGGQQRKIEPAHMATGQNRAENLHAAKRHQGQSTLRQNQRWATFSLPFLTFFSPFLSPLPLLRLRRCAPPTFSRFHKL